jgi:hypothetical protein
MMGFSDDVRFRTTRDHVGAEKKPAVARDLGGFFHHPALSALVVWSFCFFVWWV